MKLIIQSIHFTASQRLKDYIERKSNKLNQFHDRILAREVFLKLEGSGESGNKHVEIKLKIPGNSLVAQATSRTFEAATDICVDKLKEQLKRHKEKLRAATGH